MRPLRRIGLRVAASLYRVFYFGGLEAVPPLRFAHELVCSWLIPKDVMRLQFEHGHCLN